MPTNPPFSFSLDHSALAPLVRQVVAEALAALEAERATIPDRLAFSEPEAARLLGLNVWVLRGERLRGRIKASKIVGRRIRYLRSDLLDYLVQRRVEKNGP